MIPASPRKSFNDFSASFISAIPWKWNWVLRIEAIYLRVIQSFRSVAAKDLAGKQCRSEIKQCFSNHMIIICRLTDWTLWLSEKNSGGEKRQKRFKNASRNLFGIKLIWWSEHRFEADQYLKTGRVLWDENKHMYDGFQNYKYLFNQKWLLPQMKQARKIIRNIGTPSDNYMEAKCFGTESLIWIFVPQEVKQFLFWTEWKWRFSDSEQSHSSNGLFLSLACKQALRHLLNATLNFDLSRAYTC